MGITIIRSIIDMINHIQNPVSMKDHMGKKLNRHAWHVRPIERDERFHQHVEALFSYPYEHELSWGPLDTEEQARDNYFGIKRAVAHYKKTMPLSVAVYYRQLPDGRYEVRYRRHDPELAKAYMQEKLAREEGTL